MDRPQHRVSLVAPIFNGGEHYPACFQSLCRLDDLDGRLEVHVIDDASTDGTREFLRSQSPPGFMHCHYPETNLGRSRVRNHGLRHATGDVIILVDGDLEVQPDFVRAHLSELTKPGRRAVIGRVDPAPWLPRTRLHRYLYEAGHRGAQQFGPGVPIGFQYLLTRNLALSRAALDAGGLFEESFRHYGGEDTLFGYHLARAFPNGIFYSDAPAAVHHHFRTLRQHLKDFGDYGYHNLPTIMVRHPEIATPLAADFAWPLPGAYFRRRRRLGRLLFNPATSVLARAGLALAPPALGNALVRFLTVGSVVRSLRRYVRDQSPEERPPGVPPGQPPGSSPA